MALFAYLGLHPGEPIARERLATLLWGHSGQEQARRSLRQCLSSLRCLEPAPDAWFVAKNNCLLVSPNVGFEIDVFDFHRLSRSDELKDLQAAAELYKGEFLAGLYVQAESFDEWLCVERRRLSLANSDLLYRLAFECERANDLGRAVAAAQRLATLDPLREDGHRLLMQLYAKAGRRSAALEQHAICVDHLRRELGVAPEQATVDLANMIGRGKVVVSRSPFDATKIGKSPDSPDIDDPAIRKFREHALALPEKPSIAVLPFSNLSGDADQNYFADGMAEDITIALGRVPWLFVIASSSAFTYRDHAVDMRQVGVDLGVRYVLRGSVRRSSNRIRIVVQLREASRGGHIWADRYEGDLSDLFEMQDRVAAQVAAIISPTLHSVEMQQAQRRSPEDLSAYDLYLRALPRYRTTLADNQEALRLLERAIELDPSFGAAYGLGARCYQFQRLFGWVRPPDVRLNEGIRLAWLAAEIGSNDSEALWMAGIALVQLAGEVDHGLALIDKSLSLNPNSASAWISRSFVNGERGDAAAALKDFCRAQRLNPLDSMHHVQRLAAGHAHFVAGRYELALEAIEKSLSERPTYTPALRMKVITCGILGLAKESHESVRRLLAVNPGTTVSTLRAFWAAPLRRNPRLLKTLLEGARLGGLPLADPHC